MINIELVLSIHQVILKTEVGLKGKADEENLLVH